MLCDNAYTPCSIDALTMIVTKPDARSERTLKLESRATMSENIGFVVVSAFWIVGRNTYFRSLRPVLRIRSFTGS